MQAQRWRDQSADLRAENKALRGEVSSLQEQNAALTVRVGELQGVVAALKEKVVTLARLAFGTSSEKKKQKKKQSDGPGDDPGGDGPGDGADSGGERRAAGDGRRRRRGQQRGSKGHGRRDYSDMDTDTQVHDVTEGERVCPHCAAPYDLFDEAASEQIGWQVRLVRTVHIRRRYRRACRCPVPAVIAAPAVAKPIVKGRFTAEFLARLLVEKFVLGRPTHRISAALAMDGLAVPEGTLAGVYAKLGGLLTPLAQMIKMRNVAAAHLHADETRWQVFAETAGKHSHRWWLWVFLGPDTTVFTIAPSRSYQELSAHLGCDPKTGALPPGRTLSLSSDFYSVYQSLGLHDGVENLWCWAHMRRYFWRAGEAVPTLREWTIHWCERISALYRAHTTFNAAPAESPERERASEAFTTALADIDTVRQRQNALSGLHPRARKVLATLDREWEGLVRHQNYLDLPLDNNAAERALRAPVVGRKNYYGSGSVASAQLASATWTITATAGRAGANPLTYLTSYLQACATAGGRAPHDSDLARFAPWIATEADLITWRAPPQPATTTTSTAAAGPAP